LQRRPARTWVIDPHNPPIRQIHALRGHAGQPGPRAENRERGNREARWRLAIAHQAVASLEDSSRRRKGLLALAIAQGISIAVWAKHNNVPERTAYRWAREPKVRAKVASYRRHVVDEALGLMSSHVTKAASGIAALAENAVSESVKLAALRAVFSNMMAVAEFSSLDERMTLIEERLDERDRDTRRSG
jgi:hypothetical protein